MMVRPATDAAFATPGVPTAPPQTKLLGEADDRAARERKACIEGVQWTNAIREYFEKNRVRGIAAVACPLHAARPILRCRRRSLTTFERRTRTRTACSPLPSWRFGRRNAALLRRGADPACRQR